jgi:hypothetical protein
MNVDKCILKFTAGVEILFQFLHGGVLERYVGRVEVALSFPLY